MARGAWGVMEGLAYPVLARYSGKKTKTETKTVTAAGTKTATGTKTVPGTATAATTLSPSSCSSSRAPP